MKKMLLAAAVCRRFRRRRARAVRARCVSPSSANCPAPGAVSSTNFRDGALMAIDEINAKGGILGRKIELKQYDTQTNPGHRALADAERRSTRSRT
jgi:hypothetical protein